MFLIILAVALFAALSFAVTGSTRNPGSKVKEDEVRAGVAGLLQYTSAIRTNVQRMAIGGAVAGDQVMYNSEVYTTMGDFNGLSLGNPANPEKYVFHMRGGGVSARTFEDGGVSAPCRGSICTSDPWTMHYGHASFVYVNVPGVGTDEADIAFLLHSPTDEACLIVNKGLGFDKILHLNVPTYGYQAWLSVNAPPVAPDPITRPDASLIISRQEFCYFGVSPSGSNDSYESNYFLSVIWPR